MAVDRCKIIVVEPDVRALKEIEAKLSSVCFVVGIVKPERTLPTVQAERVAKLIIVSTAKGIDSLGLLDSVRRENPNLLRILLTGFEDLTQVVEGLHSGAVQRVMSKPLQHAELLGLIRSTMPSQNAASVTSPL